MNSSDAVLADARLYSRVLATNWPPLVFLVGHLVPEVLRMAVFVLIGRIVGGDEGMAFAFVGCAVLATLRSTVSEVSDVPVTDAYAGAFPGIVRSGVPLVVHYLARSSALVPVALFDAAVVIVVLGPATGNGDLVLPLLASLWLLLPAIVAGLAFGLVAVAPAIGNDFQNLAHNSANSLVTVTSGAIFGTALMPAPVLAVGSVLPFRYTVEAVRHRLAGEPYWADLGAELLVGAGWLAVAALVYAWLDRRSRRTGGGLLRT